MSELAIWTGEAPDAEEDTPETPATGPLDLSWLPSGVARRQTVDEDQHGRAVAREKRQAERESVDRAEVARNQAVAGYLADCAVRGEVPSALDIVNGNIGRTPAEVLSGAAGELADRIPKDQRAPLDAEVCLAPVRRSRVPRDGDVIGRALLAAEARRVDRRGAEAAEALNTARARRGPQAAEYADAWAAWARRDY